jgi:hypothetical protein
MKFKTLACVESSAPSPKKEAAISTSTKKFEQTWSASAAQAQLIGKAQ